MASSSSLLFDTQEEADLKCKVFDHLRVCPSTRSWASSCEGTEAVRLIKSKLDQFQTSSPRCFCGHNEHSKTCFFRVVDFEEFLWGMKVWAPQLRLHESYVGRIVRKPQSSRKHSKGFSGSTNATLSK